MTIVYSDSPFGDSKGLVVYPKTYYGDLSGKALDSGKLYIGYVNQDPEIAPLQCYWDAQLSIPAAQPLSITSGYVTNSGSRAAVYVPAENYSLRVRDKNDVLVDYIPEAGNPSATVANRTALQALSVIAESSVMLTEAGREGLFVLKTGVAPADVQQGIYVPSNTAGFYWQRVWDGVNGRPEWFGASKNDSTGLVPANNYTAIMACMALCPVTILGEGDYYTNATVRVPPYRALVGHGSYRAGSGNGTRLVITSGTLDVLAVGLSSNPGTVNSFAKASVVQGLSLGRNQPVVPPSVVAPQNGACGLRMTYTLHCRVQDVYSDDHTIGFYFNAVVRSLIVDCKAFRQTNGTTGTGDFFRGFWPDGGGSYGLSGGNGSLFLEDCNSSIGGTPTLTENTGFHLSNAFVDTFLIRPEVTSQVNGIVLDGDSAAASPAHIDVVIDNPILDGITGNGIEIREVNAYASIEIRGGYTALAGNTAFAGIYLNGTTACSGVTIFGHQVWGVNALASGANVFGVYGNAANRFSLNKVKAIGCGRPFGFDSCADFSADVIVNNPGQAGTQAAVLLANCTIGRVAAHITGQGNAFPQGVHASGTGNVKLTVDPTGINPAAITGGATNKVQINSIAITAPGYYTSAGAGGSSGAGINVIGITA